ncbi:DUF1295 domain-containing protein [Porticoccaceae bacterium LTM1]|nr:DUF1295 domain-containing protein [Porticoccaceae bacterium LTM1]
MNIWVPLLINMLAGFLCWLLSLRLKDVSIVDSLWSLMFWLAALFWLWPLGGVSARDLVLLILVSIWAWRLSIYLTVRNWGKAEDHRYQVIRNNNSPGFEWKSLFIVFCLQALLAWIASLVILGASGEKPLGWLDYLGIALWLLGFLFETVGDAQLAAFKKQAGSGAVLNKGLWRYSRHPNYFGECCLWWGLYLLAISAGNYWVVVSPILMTLLLLKVSGVSLLESTITERRPEYAEYIRRTNAFIPWLPKP